MKAKNLISWTVVVMFLMLTSSSCSMRAVHWSPRKNRGFGPPPHAPAHGHRHKLPSEVKVTFDTDCGVYIVVGLDRHFWLDGRYYRFYNGQWELSMSIDSGWRAVDVETLPPGLRGKYKTKHVSKKHPGRGWAFGQD
ncbi:MAG: hypothetical protein ACETWQ_13840 [Phycisphaerae bacterium]